MRLVNRTGVCSSVEEGGLLSFVGSGQRYIEFDLGDKI